MLTLHKYIRIILTVFLVVNYVRGADKIDEYKNKWEIGFTFGEIPFLSGSFKPGLMVGYHFNEYVFINTTIQLKDHLNRNDESFNAVNIGLKGLSSSKEITGERILIALNLRPAYWSPYLTAGFVFNNYDKETMLFGNEERIIGQGAYNSGIKITQERPSGFVPAIGLGYRYDFENGLSINTSFAMGFFNSIVDPVITLESGEPLAEKDSELLKEKINHVYKGNFHNRYHIFNLGIIYRFKSRIN